MRPSTPTPEPSSLGDAQRHKRCRCASRCRPAPELAAPAAVRGGGSVREAVLRFNAPSSTAPPSAPTEHIFAGPRPRGTSSRMICRNMRNRRWGPVNRA